jgi:hypothetical protein
MPASQTGGTKAEARVIGTDDTTSGRGFLPCRLTMDRMSTPVAMSAVFPVRSILACVG